MALEYSAFDVGQGRSTRRSRLVVAVLLTTLAFAITACDEEEHRAIAPGPVRDLSTAPANNVERSQTEEPQTLFDPLKDGVSGIDLPRADRVYFTNGGDIWQAPIDQEPAAVITDSNVAGFSPSATGHRLAVLGLERDEDDDEERSVLSLVLPSGSPIFDLSEVEGAEQLDDVSPIESIALTPSGNTLAMTHRNGALTIASLDGQVQQLIHPNEERRPGDLHWSSDGHLIAFLDPWLPNEPSGLYVLVPETGVRQVLVGVSEKGHGVEAATWIPGTSYLVYTKSSGSTISHGGDMFVVNALTGERQLLLSSGEIAPVAGVVDLAVSPDGEVVALTTFVPGDERPEFAGLWTVDLSTGDRLRVPVNRGQSVTDIWWLGENLLYRAVAEPRTRLPGVYTGVEDFELVEYDPDSGVTRERFTSE